MAEAQPDSLLGRRNRALILLGFDSACRRSELEALDVEDITFTHDGIVLTLRRSKTDQDGAGRQIGIPYRSNPTMPCKTGSRRPGPRLAPCSARSDPVASLSFPRSMPSAAGAASGYRASPSPWW